MNSNTKKTTPSSLGDTKNPIQPTQTIIKRKKKIALAIKNLSFRFNAKTPYFFKNLNTDFQANQIHFIRGQNGIGKSTLFRILQGNINKDEICCGQICLQNTCAHTSTHNMQDTKNNFIPLNKYIKMVPQNFDQMLASQFSFTQNLKLANIPEYPTLKPLPEHQPIPSLINTFNIDTKNTPVARLSGGQRQILAILMALQKQTKLLLLDEPTAALDEQNAQLVMDFLANLVSKMNLTALIICHDKELVEKYAQDGFFELVLDNTSEARKIRFVENEKKAHAC